MIVYARIQSQYPRGHFSIYHTFTVIVRGAFSCVRVRLLVSQDLILLYKSLLIHVSGQGLSIMVVLKGSRLYLGLKRSWSCQADAQKVKGQKVQHYGKNQLQF